MCFPHLTTMGVGEVPITAPSTQTRWPCRAAGNVSLPLVSASTGDADPDPEGVAEGRTRDFSPLDEGAAEPEGGGGASEAAPGGTVAGASGHP